MSVRALLLPSFLALVLGAGAAGLAACGDDGDPSGLLRSQDAEELLADLGEARDAYAGGDCDAAVQAVRRARSAAQDLPSSVDDRLARRIRRGMNALQDEIRPDCEEQQQTETVPTITETTPTETAPETTPTQTQTTTTPTTTIEPDPTETEPVPPETTPTAPEEPDGTGGFTPDPVDPDG